MWRRGSEWVAVAVSQGERRAELKSGRRIRFNHMLSVVTLRNMSNMLNAVHANESKSKRHPSLPNTGLQRCGTRH